MARTVTVHMVWSESIDVEVPDDWPEVTNLDGLPSEEMENIRPFDPVTDRVDIDDFDYEESDGESSHQD